MEQAKKVNITSIRTKRKRRVYEVKSTHTIDEVFNSIKAGKKRFNGAGLSNVRMQNFFIHGVSCYNPNCNMVGTEFRVERSSGYWHLNLYAFGNGKSIMMTADHIIPKSKGGKKILENLQPLCSKCNSRKSDKIIPVEKISSAKTTKRPKRRKNKRISVVNWKKIQSLNWWYRAIKNSILTRHKLHMPKRKKWVRVNRTKIHSITKIKNILSYKIPLRTSAVIIMWCYAIIVSATFYACY